MNKNFKKAKLSNNNIIDIELENGKKINANILFTFEENGDQFIMYEIDEIAYGAKIKEDNSLAAIEEDEWNLVEKIFNEWMAENIESDE